VVRWQKFTEEKAMTQESEKTKQWQVTCACGWRTHGTMEVVIRAVREHGRSAHGIETSDEEIIALAVPISEP
jgi:hypothetical protein